MYQSDSRAIVRQDIKFYFLNATYKFSEKTRTDNTKNCPNDYFFK